MRREIREDERSRLRRTLVAASRSRLSQCERHRGRLVHALRWLAGELAAAEAAAWALLGTTMARRSRPFRRRCRGRRFLSTTRLCSSHPGVRNSFPGLRSRRTGTKWRSRLGRLGRTATTARSPLLIPTPLRSALYRLVRRAAHVRPPSPRSRDPNPFTRKAARRAGLRYSTASRSTESNDSGKTGAPSGPMGSPLCGGSPSLV